ncbi:MAG: CapA family protein [Lachnospiraceae bacterium]|nr:CapA family protein [Lachnospiraceae bacterium]
MFLKEMLCMSMVLLLGVSEVVASGQGDEMRGNQKLRNQEESSIDNLEKMYGALDSDEEENQEISITISAVGDCTFGSDRSSPSSVNFYAVKKKQKADYFFKKVKKVFAADDLTIANLEGTLTKRGSRQPKKYAFRGDPSYVNILKKGKIEAVSFANNHCRDFGQVSYTDTRKTLEKAGIKYASYSKVGIYKVKGKRIGMIAVCGLEGLSGSEALVKSGIKKLKKKKADLIIVSMHAGIEYLKSADSTQKSLSHYAIDRGADLVLGHHPHIIQGIEKYKGKYIAYSLGNFCFGGNTNPRDKDTMIYQQTFYFKGKKLKKKTEVKLIPCSLSSKSYINDYQPKIAGKEQAARILSKMKSYSLTVKLKKGKGKIRNIICK